ncbi:MAG: hypothetical protein M1833_006992 [Piccolia ochrophora]|nr:MAG: hypothetical protein M1833_006992 [Piccolia ochrophora]
MGSPVGPAPRRALDRDRILSYLTIGVLLAALYRYCWLDAWDPFKCSALLNQGRWLETTEMAEPPRYWQPPGCTLHRYSPRDIATCLPSRKLVFVGDSTVRQVFWAVAKKLDRDGAGKQMLEAERHADITFEREGVTAAFLWDPYLNSTRLRRELVTYREESKSALDQIPPSNASAALVLVGGGLWHARHVSVNPMKHFKDAVDDIVAYMGSSDPQTTTLGTQPHGSSNFLLLAPVQIPWYDKLSPARAKTITRDKINPMNDYLQQLSAHQSVDVVWSFARMTWQRESAYEESGLHVIDKVADQRADVLLNLKCNAHAAGPHGTGYPYDRTCCSNYRRPGWVQWMGLLCGVAILPGLSYLGRNGNGHGESMRSGNLIRWLLTFSLAVCLCFFTDRTQVFNKESKFYSDKDFLSLCGVALALGILSIRRSSVPDAGKAGSGAPLMQPEQPFLSRDQTDEWKGWMQFVILIYHYCGASKILPIYEVVRVLVASYLFMTGYGHTLYFYTRKDYSLRRLSAVLIRLNLLSCILPYMMRTDYLFYYFAPLVSFWFLVVYLTMRLRHERNDSTSFLLGKIALSALLVATLTNVHGPLEVVFAVLKYTCRIHWDVNEWRFRASLDIFIVYVGMLVAIGFAHLTASRASVRDKSAAFAIVHRNFRRLHLSLVVAALVLIPGFWALTRRSPDKADYNWWQPYISFIPILSFVVLRNAHRHLRNFHSSVFAWLGRCSLETYTLQFHIWLAADTKGLLHLGLFGLKAIERWTEFGILTAVFLYVSWNVSLATGAISDWIVNGGESRTSSRPRSGDDRHHHFLDYPRSRNHGETGNEQELQEVIDGSANAPSHHGMFGKGGYPVNPWRRDLNFRIVALLLGLWCLNVVSLRHSTNGNLIYASTDGSAIS